MAEVVSEEPDLEVVPPEVIAGTIGDDGPSPAVVLVLAGSADPTVGEIIASFEGLSESGLVVAWCGPPGLAWRPRGTVVDVDGGLEALLRALRSTDPAPERVAVLADQGAAKRRRSFLTDRELEVLRLIGAGRTAKQVGAQLGISAKAVGNHKRRIFAKLRVQNQTQAVAHALKSGLMTAGKNGAPLTRL